MGAGAKVRGDPIFADRSRTELEFLPAALEIAETPPPPLPRVTAMALVALLIAGIAWAAFGQIDIVATAPGRLTPSGGGKVVQPLETGTVTAIRVHDGEVVRQGDVLVELDPTETEADQDRLKGELAAAQLEESRLQVVALGRPFAPPPGSDPLRAEVAQREVREEVESNAAKLSSLDHQIAEHRAELASGQAEAARLKALLPYDQQRVDAFTDLQNKGYGSKLQLVEAQEKLEDARRSLEVERQKQPALEAAIQTTAGQRAEIAAETSKKALADLTEAQIKAASLADEVAKADERFRGRTLTAPVSGAVQELAVHTIGGVVEPGQTLMRIAPAGAPLEVEANLENKDVGFVRPGMAAVVKVESFPFTRYGLIHATVLSVSADALGEPTAQNPIQGRTADLPGLMPEPHYLVRLALDHDVMTVDGRQVRLRPGMMVTTEVRTGRRSVISYILSPLAKAVREAGHER
jgi:hemolysin D